MYVSSITRISPPHAGPLRPPNPGGPADVLDVPVTLDISREDKVLQGTTVIGPRHVLGRYFHGSEFIKFVVFDVLMSCAWE